CEGIALYKDIRAREAGFDTIKSKIDEIKTRLDAADLIYQEEMGKYNSMECQGSLPQEKYDRCVAQGEVIDQKVEIYNDLVQEYNQALDEYHADFGQYEIVFDTFDTLMQKANQGCAVVVTDSISKQEEADTINQ
ncbi:MAG: hypothetical protein MUP11_05990, partial [Anaerolineales bacterium]|nr:hypothetical protein [Anaerolineales bacterium]